MTLTDKDDFSEIAVIVTDVDNDFEESMTIAHMETTHFKKGLPLVNSHSLESAR